MENLSAYEQLRKKNIEENRRMLESLGLLKPFSKSFPPKPAGIVKKSKSLIIANRKRKKEFAEDVDQDAITKRRKAETKEITKELSSTSWSPVRRSLRVKGFNPDLSYSPKFLDDIEDKDSEDNDSDFRTKQPKLKRENTFGPIEDVSVGTCWATRLECSRDGIHRPTVAGIHGSETEGCYSIALSGGYEDDIDIGESFTYTGEGGRDLKGTKANPKNLRTAPQSKEQRLSKGNLALSRNVENRRPVRVIRGYKCPSLYAPDEGYRYDGIYTVEKCWNAIGLSGFGVYKFILKRCKGQAPPPWDCPKDNEENNENGKDTNERHSTKLILHQNGDKFPIVEVHENINGQNNGCTSSTESRDQNNEIDECLGLTESEVMSKDTNTKQEPIEDIVPPTENHESIVNELTEESGNNSLDKDGVNTDKVAEQEVSSQESVDQESDGGER